MALNPSFASASVNPSQTMGNDASAPAQGALPTSSFAMQNTGFSGLGGQANQPQYTMWRNEPSAPDVSENAYQRYAGQQTLAGGATQQYGDWANSQVYGGPPMNYQPSPPPFMPQGTSALPLGMPPMEQPLGMSQSSSPYGGAGVNFNIPNGQQPQGDSFMGGNPFNASGYGGVKPTGMGGFYAEETGFTPPQGYNQLGEFIGQQPQGNMPPRQPIEQEPFAMPQVGNLGNDVEIPKLNYLGYKPGWQQEADNTWSYNTPNMSPYNQREQDWNPQYIGYRGVPNDMYQDASSRGDFSGITDKYTSFTKPRYMSFGNDKTDYSQIGLSQTALDHLKMMSGAQDAGQFSYDTQTGMFNQGAGWGQNPRPGERQYLGMTDIPLDVMNKLGSGEEIDFSPYRRYTNGFNTLGQPNPPQIGDQPLPEQQPQPDGTTLRDIALQEPMPVQQPQVLNGVTGTPASPLTPTATPTGTTPMATNPLSQVPVAKTAAYTPAPVVGTASSGGGSFTQGAPLPNITTTQQQVTAAPEFYTDYLNQLAKQGASTAQNAQYVGATDLQNQAFDRTSQNVGNYQPTLQNAINLAQNAGGMSAANVANPYIQGAARGSALDVANPYIQAAASGSALNAASPYLNAASQNAYNSVNNYMNPYVNNVVDQIGALGQRQIQQNLAPQASAGIVGSGQFGSKRGAQALGQTISDANQNILATQGQALNTGYQNAMQAAQADMARQLQAGSTAGQLSTSDLARQLQAGVSAGQFSTSDLARLLQSGATAGQLTSSDMQNRIASAQQLGNLASTTQQLGLGDINALATMGGQKQTIAQNEQLFPMQQLTNQSQLLRGYTIPTSTGSSYTGPIPGAYAASPLQQIAGLGALGAGISQTKLGDALGGMLTGTGDAASKAAQAALSKIFGIGGTTALPSTNETNLPPIRTPDGVTATPNGDGSYTTSDGRIVGVDGNPIPGYVYPDPGGNNETPFPGNFDYNDTTLPIPTDETYNSWFGD